jgi:hypothetical protein
METPQPDTKLLLNQRKGYVMLGKLDTYLFQALKWFVYPPIRLPRQQHKPIWQILTNFHENTFKH